MNIPVIRFIILLKECDRKGGEIALQKLNLQESMSYQEYIHHSTWNIISDFCRTVQPTCTQCGATYNLETHHLHYKYMTMEMYHLETLTVLCDMHHTLIHMLITAAKKNKQSLPSEWISFPNIQSLIEKKEIDIYEMVSA